VSPFHFTGAPGEIRTPDLLVRRAPWFFLDLWNQQVGWPALHQLPADTRQGQRSEYSTLRCCTRYAASFASGSRLTSGGRLRATHRSVICSLSFVAWWGWIRAAIEGSTTLWP